MAAFRLHESFCETNHFSLFLDIYVSWNYSLEWMIFILLLCQKLRWIRTKPLRTTLGCICTKSYFRLNKNLNCLWMNLIVIHISTQTFCVWSIDCRVIVVRRQERKCQCPRQFGMHWTNARLCKARCYSLIDKKFIEG